MRAVQTLLFYLTLAVIASFPPVSMAGGFAMTSAGDPEIAQQTAVQPDPPGTIDGAKNPELIPDAVAYRLVILAVAEPENPTDQQKARALAKISAAGLSDDDSKAFLLHLAQFHTAKTGIDAQIAQIRARNQIVDPSGADARLLFQLGNQWESLVAKTIADLPAKLSRDGMARLYAYIQEAKRGMKYIPD